MKNLNHIFLIIFVLSNLITNAQTKNIFLGRDFWKSNPTIEQVEAKIKEGNSPTEMNRFRFDAVAYALLENAYKNVIKHLIEKDGNGVNKLTHDGRTYIFWASYKNNMPIVKYLLKNGAKTDIIDDKGYSLLNFTAVAGVQNTKLYDLLIENGANPKKEKTPKGANAMLLIIPKLKDFKMVDYFTKKGLNINTTDNDGNGAFNYTAQTGNKEMLQKLISKGLPYKNLNKNGGNAMLFATKGSRKGYNSLDFFKFLEGLGIHPNIKNNDGKTPLHNIAYRNKDKATFEYFINKGVNVNETNKDGNNALMLSTYSNNLDIIKMLASKTNNINHKNNDGKSALTNALRNKPEVIKFLIDNKADLQIIDKKGNNLAYYLFKTFRPNSTEDFNKKLAILSKNGLDFSKKQNNGSTLFHLAVEKQSIPMLEMLKNYKIDINATNKNGISPLQKAVMTATNDRIIKKLIALGANKNVTTDFDETLYDLAKENEGLKNIDISFLK